jgi:hypothetical protein
MPRGTSPLDEARLQGRLWTPELARFTTYATTARRDALTFATGVSVWRNLGTQGATGDLTQATGSAQPDIEYLPNGRLVLSFSTSKSIAQATNTAGVGTGTSSHSLAILAAMKPSGTRARIWAANGSGHNYLFGWWSGNKGRWFDHVAFRVSGGADDRQWHIFTASVTSGTGLMREDGAVIGSGLTISNGPREVTVGVVEPSDCFVAAVAVAPTAFSTHDLERLEGAWMWEFGLQTRLIGTHPYRNRPPLIGG